MNYQQFKNAQRGERREILKYYDKKLKQKTLLFVRSGKECSKCDCK
jgi:hypothetical protein